MGVVHVGRCSEGKSARLKYGLTKSRPNLDVCFDVMVVAEDISSPGLGHALQQERSSLCFPLTFLEWPGIHVCMKWCGNRDAIRLLRNLLPTFKSSHGSSVYVGLEMLEQ